MVAYIMVRKLLQQRLFRLAAAGVAAGVSLRNLVSTGWDGQVCTPIDAAVAPMPIFMLAV